MKLILLRHGEIPSNVNKIYAGTSSEELTARGLAQAREIAGKLREYNVHAMYSSPIQRAVQTANIVSCAIGLNYKIEHSFRELEMGIWEGLAETEVESRYPEEWKLWNTRPAELKVKGRETLDELLGRVLQGIRNIYQSRSDMNVIVVTHVAIIRVLLLWNANKSLNFYKTIHVPNAEVFVMEIKACP